MEDPGWRVSAEKESVAGEKSGALDELSEIRAQIDDLDQATATLLCERLLLGQRLRQVKASLQLPVLDRRRELEVLESVSRSSTDPNLARAIQTIYESVIDQTRQVQCGSLTAKGSSQATEEPPRAKRAQGARRSPLYFPRVLVVGLGLIGGSLCRQIKRLIPETVLTGVDRPEVLAEALAAGAIDVGSTELTQALPWASLIILAAGPHENLRLLEEIAFHLHRRQLVIDVTSTKSAICSLAEHLDLQGADFIGGHPFFGSEKSGFANSCSLEVDGKLFCLVPTGKSSEISLRRLSRWLSSLNLQVEVRDAKSHDAVAAQLSHLVQLLAVLLGAQLADGLSEDELGSALKLAGPSFRQIARLMGSPAQLWCEISEQNKGAIAHSLKQFKNRLQLLVESLELGDSSQLACLFELASKIPRALP